MSDKNKPLPTPPNRKRMFQENEAGSRGADIIADKLMAASAEGRLEDMLKEIAGDNENSRRLAMMMLGMSGMSPVQNQKSPVKTPPAPPAPDMPPSDVINAAQSGDVAKMIDLLKREHSAKAGGDAGMDSSDNTPSAGITADQGDKTLFDQATLDSLIEMARQNNVSMDWLIGRAVSLYVKDYEKTGRL